MLIPDGFPGQRIQVLPRPLVRRMRTAPITGRLLVTDAGYFPHAARHGRTRPAGAPEAIIIVCTEGSGLLTAGDVEVRASAGEAAVIPEGLPHSYRADERDPWSIWWLHVCGTDAAPLIDAVRGPENALTLKLRDTYAATSLVDRALSSMEHDETAASLIPAAGAAWHLLTQLTADRMRGQARSHDRIRFVQEHLRQNLATRQSVAELAKLAGLSTSHFSALFKQSAGMGVLEYLRRLRNARARELLITTALPVAEIAERVGYSDPLYFSRQFHAVNGVSPTAFRAASI
ncbi:MAG TPA: AraC family transcriptional regulator [Kribbella sp.]|nr:AraC family transcriptional regulator [Kribbella sp.]